MQLAKLKLPAEERKAIKKLVMEAEKVAAAMASEKMMMMLAHELRQSWTLKPNRPQSPAMVAAILKCPGVPRGSTYPKIWCPAVW